MKPQFIYDKESEVLSIEVGKAKSVDSDVSGNLVIDYDKSGKVVRVNVYHFSFDAFRNGIKVLKQFANSSRARVVAR